MADASSSSSSRRGNATRTDPELRRSLILDAAEKLFAEGDPLLVTFEEVARAAGVSRALVYRYIPDRRGLHEAVQARVIARLDRWVGHGMDRAGDPAAARRALVHGVRSFVEEDPDGWGVLVATGGHDHPAFHRLRERWCSAAAPDGGSHPRIVVAGILAAMGDLVARGDEADDAISLLDAACRAEG